jgi:hypothetical protein
MTPPKNPRKNPRQAPGPYSVASFRRAGRRPRIGDTVVLGFPPGELTYGIAMERQPPSQAWALRPHGALDADEDRWLGEADFSVLRYRGGAWREFAADDNHGARPGSVPSPSGHLGTPEVSRDKHNRRMTAASCRARPALKTLNRKD